MATARLAAAATGDSGPPRASRVPVSPESHDRRPATAGSCEGALPRQAAVGHGAAGEAQLGRGGDHVPGAAVGLLGRRRPTVGGAVPRGWTGHAPGSAGGERTAVTGTTTGQRELIEGDPEGGSRDSRRAPELERPAGRVLSRPAPSAARSALRSRRKGSALRRRPGRVRRGRSPATRTEGAARPDHSPRWPPGLVTHPEGFTSMEMPSGVFHFRSPTQ